MKLRLKLLGAFAVLLLVFVITATTVFYASQSHQNASRDVERSHEVIADINDIVWYLSQMQTSFRSYMVAGDSGELATFHVASQQFDIAFDAFKQDVLLDPPQFGRMVSIEQDVRDWRNDIVEPGMEIRRLTNDGLAEPEAPMEFLQLTVSQPGYMEIGALLQETLSYENRVLSEREQDVIDGHRLERGVMIVGSVVVVILGAGLALLIANDVAGAVGSLGSQAQRIASGDFGARIRSRRLDEVGNAASAFDDMADHLERLSADLKNTADSATSREQRMRTIVDNVAEGLISFTGNGAITSTNPAANAMFLIEGQSLLGNCVTDLLQSSDADRSIEIEDIIPESGTGTVSLHSVDGKRTDGTSFALEMVIREIPDGPEREFMSIMRDISERRVAELRLLEQVRVAEEAETRVRAVLDATSDAMVLASDEEITLIANQKFADFFEVQADELVGVRSEDIVSAAKDVVLDIDRLVAMVQQGRDHPDDEILDMMTQIWPVEREIELSSIPVKTPAGVRQGRLYSLRDVTHQREVDRLKNEFVSLVSHELRTPLTSIKGYVDLLLDEESGALTDDQREFLQIVGSNAQRLVNMVNELLDISRIEAGKVDLRIDSIDLRALAQRVVASMRPLIDEKRQSVIVDAEPGLPPVYGDSDRLSQILTNLVSNAVKYTARGGHITISLRPDDGMMKVGVQDTGVGLTEDEIRQLFTRFYRAGNRATREVAGAGLGLSITRSLVELHGGAISVKSTPGEGSTFTFTVPLAEGVTPAQIAEPVHPVAGGTILLVEDDEDIASLIAHYLTRAGHTVSIAPDAETAIALSRSSRFDLVTLDVILPDQDGFALLQELRENSRNPHVPVMIISMMPDDGTGTALGAIDYVVKPVEEHALIERVARALRDDRAQDVLVADDDDDLRRVVVAELQRRGHRIREARDGLEAMAIAQEHDLDLALLDVHMPGMSGIDVLRALRESSRTRTLPVIMLTGDDRVLSNRDRDPGLTSRDILLSKALSPRDIASLIDSILEKQGIAGT
jgi:PAS domain S-box-containing protein